MPTRLEDVPSDLIVDFDLHDPELADVMHERLAEIQDSTPVAWSPAHGGAWLVTRYDDVHEVLKDWKVFSGVENTFPAILPMKSLPLEYDPPEHTAYRQIINPLFSPARMKALEPSIRETCRELLDGFADKGEVEFVSAYAHPVPTATFISLMGWSMDDADLFSRWNQEILVGDPHGTEEESMDVRVNASMEVFAYFTKMIEERRAQPDVDDVSGVLLRSLYEGTRPLDDDELLRAHWLLMLGGLHTVRGVLANGIIALAQQPDEVKRLVSDPSLITDAVEEMLRIGAPIVPGRVLVEDIEFRGVQMRAGDRIVAFTSAANRDEREFACPHQMQLDREANRHLTFGGGPHRCVGSNLARVELAIALEEFLARIPEFRLDPERPVDRHHGQVTGVNAAHLLF